MNRETDGIGNIRDPNDEGQMQDEVADAKQPGIEPVDDQLIKDAITLAKLALAEVAKSKNQVTFTINRSQADRDAETLALYLQLPQLLSREAQLEKINETRAGHTFDDVLKMWEASHRQIAADQETICRLRKAQQECNERCSELQLKASRLKDLLDKMRRAVVMSSTMSSTKVKWYADLIVSQTALNKIVTDKLQAELNDAKRDAKQQDKPKDNVWSTALAKERAYHLALITQLQAKAQAFAKERAYLQAKLEALSKECYGFYDATKTTPIEAHEPEPEKQPTLADKIAKDEALQRTGIANARRKCRYFEIIQKYGIFYDQSNPLAPWKIDVTPDSQTHSIRGFNVTRTFRGPTPEGVCAQILPQLPINWQP
jgi:hypothetical protein